MRAPQAREILLATLRIEERGDGGILVTSQDVPGLYLSGADAEHTWTLVPVAVAELARRNQGLDVVRVLCPPLPGGDRPRQASAEVEVAVQLATAA